MTAAIEHLAYDPNNIRPGWIAFVVVMALCVATFFLWRNMNTQLRRIKLPQDEGGVDPADAQDPPAAAEPEESPTPSDGDDGQQPTDRG